MHAGFLIEHLLPSKWKSQGVCERLPSRVSAAQYGPKQNFIEFRLKFVLIPNIVIEKAPKLPFSWVTPGSSLLLDNLFDPSTHTHTHIIENRELQM